MDQLDSNFTVYTNYDNEVDFTKFETFYLPDSIMLVGQGMKHSYWTDESAQELVALVADNLVERGYTRVNEPADASLGVQLSYVEQTTQVTGFVGGNWYGGWWDPGFWGPYWGGWYYPYPVSYTYNTGTFIMEMLDLTKPSDVGAKKAELPVIWQAYAAGMLSGNSKLNKALVKDAISQSFEQSNYIRSFHK